MINRASDQCLDRAGESTCHGSDGKGGRSVKKRQPPANAVGNRAADELTDGQAGQKERQRQLHRPALCPQTLLDMRERRQVHVDAERPERIEQTEENNKSNSWARGDQLSVRGGRKKRRQFVLGHYFVSDVSISRRPRERIGEREPWGYMRSRINKFTR